MTHWNRQKLRQGIMLIAALIVWVNASACGGLSVANSAGIDAQTLLQQINTDTAPVILDVRTVEEFEAGHVPGAVNIPIQELGNRLDELEAIANNAPDNPIVVYCERGVRANRAETMLNDAEFEQILHLEGDMQQWRQDNLPTEFPK